MKVLVLGIVLCLTGQLYGQTGSSSGTLYSWQAGGSLSQKSTKNIAGGQNHYQNGQYTVRSTPNISGGFNFYKNGQYIGTSRPNINGGYNFKFYNSQRTK